MTEPRSPTTASRLEQSMKNGFLSSVSREEASLDEAFEPLLLVFWFWSFGGSLSSVSPVDEGANCSSFVRKRELFLAVDGVLSVVASEVELNDVALLLVVTVESANRGVCIAASEFSCRGECSVIACVAVLALVLLSACNWVIGAANDVATSVSEVKLSAAVLCCGDDGEGDPGVFVVGAAGVGARVVDAGGEDGAELLQESTACAIPSSPASASSGMHPAEPSLTGVAGCVLL